MVNCIETLKQIGIVPVIQIERAEDAKPLGETLKNAGLFAAEITFRTEAAAEALRIMASEVPELFVCAGTILTPEDAERAVAGGAKAIISPGTNPAVVRWCIEHDVPVIPGCATPSEVEWCMREGLNMVKLFPAEVVGGVSMLKALAGPYAVMQFMPTGGISPDNVGAYLSLSNVAACGGSWIVPKAFLQKGQFDKIEALAREAVCLAKRYR